MVLFVHKEVDVILANESHRTIHNIVPWKESVYYVYWRSSWFFKNFSLVQIFHGKCKIMVLIFEKHEKKIIFFFIQKNIFHPYKKIYNR